MFFEIIKNYQSCFLFTSQVTILFLAEATPGGDWRGTVPPLLAKVIFVNRLKPMRKYWGY